MSDTEPVRAFANGTEGYGWMANWCHRCAVDAPYQAWEQDDRATGPAPEGCQWQINLVLNERPPVFLDGPRDEHGRYSISDQYVCIDFRDEDDGPGDTEPQPIPTPDGQLELVPREDYQGVRMYAGLTQIEVSA